MSPIGSYNERCSSRLNGLQLFFMQARAGITEVHFLPFNPVDKRTAITYIDENGDWHRSSKGAPEQVSCFSS